MIVAIAQWLSERRPGRGGTPLAARISASNLFPVRKHSCTPRGNRLASRLPRRPQAPSAAARGAESTRRADTARTPGSRFARHSPAAACRRQQHAQRVGLGRLRPPSGRWRRSGNRSACVRRQRPRGAGRRPAAAGSNRSPRDDQHQPQCSAGRRPVGAAIAPGRRRGGRNSSRTAGVTIASRRNHHSPHAVQPAVELGHASPRGDGHERRLAGFGSGMADRLSDWPRRALAFAGERECSGRANSAALRRRAISACGSHGFQRARAQADRLRAATLAGTDPRSIVHVDRRCVHQSANPQHRPADRRGLAVRAISRVPMPSLVMITVVRSARAERVDHQHRVAVGRAAVGLQRPCTTAASSLPCEGCLTVAVALPMTRPSMHCAFTFPGSAGRRSSSSGARG